jgi:hypothetical protein
MLPLQPALIVSPPAQGSALGQYNDALGRLSNWNRRRCCRDEDEEK